MSIVMIPRSCRPPSHSSITKQGDATCSTGETNNECDGVKVNLALSMYANDKFLCLL